MEAIPAKNRYIERAFKAEEKKHWNGMPLCDLIQKVDGGALPIVIRDGYIWGHEMDRQELETAHREAWSFPGLSPPQGARYIGCQRRSTGLYRYWKDAAGKYWYETDQGMAFKREMEAAQKKIKKASRGNWMPG